MLRKCPRCGKEITNDNVRFCSDCGMELPLPDNLWRCTRCGAENFTKSNICLHCGAKRSENTGKELYDAKRKKRRLNVQRLIILIIVMLFALGGSYYFFNYRVENGYFSHYTEVLDALQQSEKAMSSVIKFSTLKKGDNVSEAQETLKNQKDNLDDVINKFAKEKVLEGYKQQHEDALQLLKEESAVLSQINSVLDNPLASNTDSKINGIQEDIQTIKNLESKIKIENHDMSTGVDISNIPEELKDFVIYQRLLPKSGEESGKEKYNQQQSLNAYKSHATEDNDLKQYSTLQQKALRDTSVPIEYRNALKTGLDYARHMDMSKQEVYEQLTSSYGEQFPVDAAQWAMKHMSDVNWKENALKAAESYQRDMNMSVQSVYEQLVSPQGEQFTEEEAQYAIQHLPK